MENKIADIILILGVGIAGIYISHIISPYISSGITKGLEVVSEKIITLPLPEEKETTKFVFFTLSFTIVSQILMSILDVANGYSFIDTYINTPGYYDVIEDVTPLASEVIKYTSLKDSIINDIKFLEESQFVTNFLFHPDKANGLLALKNCLLLKYFNSSILGAEWFFQQQVPAYEANLYRLQNIPNHELIRTASLVRDFYVSKTLGLDVYCEALLKHMGIDSEQEMILLLMEATTRYGVSLGGVTAHELILRNVMGLTAYIDNPNMFDAYFKFDGMRSVIRNEFIDGVWTQTNVMVRNCVFKMHPSCPVMMVDGCIDSYRWDVDDYGVIDMDGTHMRDIIFKDKVMKMLWNYCRIL